MATINSNAFELERRGFQWSMNNTLDDGNTSLLYDGDPNSIVDGNSLGETKLYSLLPGATYFETTGDWWIKTSSPNVWSQISTGSSGALGDTASNIATLSADVTTLKANATHFTLPRGSENLVNFLGINLSNSSTNLSTSEVICFDTSTIRSGKLVISAYNDSHYISTELLITYYNASGTPGIDYVEYATMGTEDLITFGARLSGTAAVLQLTPALTGLHVDIQHTVVLSTTAPPP